MFVLFAAAAIICLLYYVTITLYAGAGSSFVSFWLLAFLAMAVLSALFFVNKKRQIFSEIPGPVFVVIGAVFLAGVLLFAALFGSVVSGMFSEPADEAEYVIVLGAQIRGDTITRSLKKRLDAACEYYMENADRDITIIVSGGQGEGENTTEALAMKNYLLDKGIDGGHIIMEDNSTTTNENLIFSYRIICDRGGEEAAVLICSNNFHIFRALKLAEHIGIRNAEGLPAPGDNVLLLNYMVREVFALVKEYMLGNIDLL